LADAPHHPKIAEPSKAILARKIIFRMFKRLHVIFKKITKIFPGVPIISF
jgi:hypothetical protein